MLKHKNLFITVTIATLVVLAGCSKSDDNSTHDTRETVVIHGYTLPPKPDPVINNSTIATCRAGWI